MIDCQIGYYGINCSKPCRYPNYGNDCQQHCSRCKEEACNPMFGCLATSTTTSIGTLELHVLGGIEICIIVTYNLNCTAWSMLFVLGFFFTVIFGIILSVK